MLVVFSLILLVTPQKRGFSGSALHPSVCGYVRPYIHTYTHTKVTYVHTYIHSYIHTYVIQFKRFQCVYVRVKWVYHIRYLWYICGVSHAHKKVLFLISHKNQRPKHAVNNKFSTLPAVIAIVPVSENKTEWTRLVLTVNTLAHKLFNTSEKCVPFALTGTRHSTVCNYGTGRISVTAPACHSWRPESACRVRRLRSPRMLLLL